MTLLLIAALLDPQIAGVASAANEAAINRAELARELSKDGRTHSFANQLLAERGQSQVQMTSLGIVHERSDESRALAKAAQEEEAQLRALPAGDFDGAFIRCEMADEERLLGLLDSELLPQAHDAALRDLLRKLRRAAASDLSDARRLLEAKPSAGEHPAN